MIASETQVWRDTERLVSYLIDITMLFPKAYKFTIGQKITNVSLELFEYIQLANMTTDVNNRKRYLQGFQVKFELLKVLLRLSTEKKVITLKQTASITTIVVGIGKQISAWKNRQ
ncbi:four helix bundle protein [Bacteroides reticulotermitis]|uniref:bAvd-like domain-containing protein n=1 Tax=Bacteroides reticulotermitis TaxID=1133319 RepID=A0A840D640_9BACE|nr:four helix bundle protein [Bacteroides reticulotermitis]MBB4043863.1 hypothetical protein [Bacteroides reticulotermitis]